MLQPELECIYLHYSWVWVSNQGIWEETSLQWVRAWCKGWVPECDFALESPIPEAKALVLASVTMCFSVWNQEDKTKDEVIWVAVLHQNRTVAKGCLQFGTGYFDSLGMCTHTHTHTHTLMRVGKSRLRVVEYTKQSLFLYYCLLIIVLYSIQMTVNLLLPTLRIHIHKHIQVLTVAGLFPYRPSHVHIHDRTVVHLLQIWLFSPKGRYSSPAGSLT